MTCSECELETLICAMCGCCKKCGCYCFYLVGKKRSSLVELMTGDYDVWGMPCESQ